MGSVFLIELENLKKKFRIMKNFQQNFVIFEGISIVNIQVKKLDQSTTKTTTTIITTYFV